MGPTRDLSVLLVEDNPGDAHLIQMYFGNGHRETFHLRVVDRISDAIREVEENAPDAILLDLGLPDSQGLETLDRIFEKSDGAPIVVLTGLDDEELALEAIQRGAQDYLPKGAFDDILLVRTVRYAVERSAAETLARRNQERYERLFEQANEAVLVVQDEHIIGANPTAEEIFGWTSNELIGKRFENLVLPEDRDFVMNRHRRRMEGEDPPSRYEFRVVHRDGHPRWVEVSSGRTEWKGRLANLNLLTDIGERKKSEQQTERLLTRQTAVNELTLALGTRTGTREICAVLYEHVKSVLDTDGFVVSFFDPDSELIRAGWVVIEGVEQDPSRVPVLPLEDDRSIQSRVIRTGQGLYVPDWYETVSQYRYHYTLTASGVVEENEPKSREEWKGFVNSALIAPMIYRGSVIGLLQLGSHELDGYDDQDLEMLSGLANVAAIALRNSELVIQSQTQAAKIREAFEGIIQTISRTTETRDPYTAGHQQRVAQLSAAMAETLGLDADTVEGVRVAGTVHDIGKIGIPAEILSKPGKLTETEFRIIQAHCESAFKILESVDFPWPIAEAVFQHHERLDGSGYPRGLSGDEITLEARILGVADVVEAMASHRPYRPALGIDAALDEIKEHNGTRFDKQAVEACLALFDERGFHFDEPVSS